MNFVKNNYSFSGKNPKSALFDKKINELLGFDEIFRIPEIIDSDAYALGIMEETLIKLKKRMRVFMFNNYSPVNSIALSSDGTYIVSVLGC